MTRRASRLEPEVGAGSRTAPHETLDAVRRDGRVVDGGGLENRCTGKPYRGFESLSLRHKSCNLAANTLNDRSLSFAAA